MKVGLEQCQRSLYLYLEAKRRAFPRFYFVSDQALLHILSKGANPHAIQRNLGDCFDNLARLTFKEEEVKDEKAGTIKKKLTNTALIMHSKDGGEEVELMEPFECKGAVEDWLARLVQAMRDTLRVTFLLLLFAPFFAANSLSFFFCRTFLLRPNSQLTTGKSRSPDTNGSSATPLRSL